MNLQAKLSILSKIERALTQRNLNALHPKFHRTIRSLSEADARESDHLKMRHGFYKDKQALRKQREKENFKADPHSEVQAISKDYDFYFKNTHGIYVFQT
jgi:hypothetical protein